MNLMEIAQSLRMYLVQENGPTKLVLEDPEHNKYRVQIGSEVSCSCGGGKEEHCAHTVSKDVLTRLDIRADQDIQDRGERSTAMAALVLRLRDRQDPADALLRGQTCHGPGG